MLACTASIRREFLHNQLVLLPNAPAWRDILRAGTLEGLPLSSPDHIDRWLDEFAHCEGAYLGLVSWRDKWLSLPLLRLANRYYRVQFEHLTCEHCEYDCGPSARPDPVSYAFGGYTTSQTWAEFKHFPAPCCPLCGGAQRQRQTVWLFGCDELDLVL